MNFTEMAQIMDSNLGSSIAPIPPARKVAARIALLDIQEPARSVLTDCFKQFGMEAITIMGYAAECLRQQKFDACVLSLSPEAEPVMEAARSSPSNARIVIYGVGGSAQEAMRFSRYGVNAVFTEPVERQAALKLVRATQMLVQHEFRRYVRLPVITEVTLMDKTKRRFTATSKEVSSGGMSISCESEMAVGTQLEVSFALLTLPRVSINGTICWRAKNSYGVRFDLLDDRRKRLKDWVQAYLEN
ncbi:MAG TPA: PilZ domain-containing protein [Terriglobales bacterium]